MTQVKQALAIISAAFTFGCGVEPGDDAGRHGTPSVPEAKDTNAMVDPLKLPSAVLSKCKDATVLIGNFENGTLKATGSGVVCDDGKTVLTNKHIVTGTDDVLDDCKLVFFSGTERARIVQVSANEIAHFDEAKRSKENFHELDIAAIRINEKVAEPLGLGDPKYISETDAAWAFGFPQGTDIRTSGAAMPTPTVHVMRVERVQKKGKKVKVLQLSGSPTSGDSGGPVVTRDGEVIGILQAKAESGSSIIYGVPLAAITDVVARAKEGRLVASQFAAPIREIEKKARPSDTGRKPIAPSPSETKPRLVGRSALSEGILSSSDLAGMTARTLTVLRNEPFARRGYIFKRAELNRVFAEFEWYVPRTRNLPAVQSLLSGTERRNVDIIKAFQVANDLEW